jgi:hypothetical protein
LRKNTRQRRPLSKSTKKTHRQAKRVNKKQNKKKTRKQLKKQKNKKGGNLFPAPVYDKIVSIGYELESPYLVPLRYSSESQQFVQIPPSQIKPYYDMYYQDTRNNEIFTVITDNEYTEFNAAVANKNVFVNDIPVVAMGDGQKFGHTEFLITFKSPARSDQIIQTTLQQAIRKINGYLHKLVPTNIELHLVDGLDSSGSRDIPWTIFEDKEHHNYYLPSFLDKPSASVQSIDSLKNDMKFTVQMTFGSEFIDCISVVQNLLAVSSNSIIQEHAVFLNNIVAAVENNVNNQGGFTQLQMRYIKTYLVLIIYRYEAYKKYLVSYQNNRAALYKYECYFYIRHDFDDMLEYIVQEQLGDQVDAYEVILGKYNGIVAKEPQYESKLLVDFLLSKEDYLVLESNDIDRYSNKFDLMDDSDVVLIEFRGFQDELEQFIKSYAPANKHRQIQQDLDECSERITGCYSLDTLNAFAAVNFDKANQAKKDKKRIMDAPRPSRDTRKAPSRFDDA